MSDAGLKNKVFRFIVVQMLSIKNSYHWLNGQEISFDNKNHLHLSGFQNDPIPF